MKKRSTTPLKQCEIALSALRQGPKHHTTGADICMWTVQEKLDLILQSQRAILEAVIAILKETK